MLLNRHQAPWPILLCPVEKRPADLCFLQNKPVAEGAPESPTTARPLEMDDDDVQEPVPDATQQGLEAPASTDASQISHSQPSEATPPKPPRPATATQNNEGMLKEAFPGVDNAVIKAVLRASGGRVEPAFNALLGE